MPSSTNKDPAFWKRHANRYDRVARLLNSNFDEMVARVAELVDGSARVLEIAAGTGLVTQAVAGVVDHLVATDTSEDMLEILRGRMADLGASNVEVRTADALALPFEDSDFDAVVAANVLHLLPDPETCLSQMRRVLRPNGLLCVPTFCHADTTTAHVVSRLLRLGGFRVVTRFTGDSLEAAVRAAGLSIDKRERFAGVLPLWLVAGRDHAA